MFSTSAPVAHETSIPRAAVGLSRPFNPSPTVDEVYEMRLLAEVARWDDEAAFEELHARHRAAVVSVALQVCRDAGTAEDIAQQTFTALWIRAERLVAKSVRLRLWLTTVARNAAIDVLRTRRVAASIDEASTLAATGETPEAAAATADENTRLRAALAQLPLAQRAAIEWVYLGGMTHAVTADTLGAPIGTIKSRLRLGIAHLRVLLEQQR